MKLGDPAASCGSSSKKRTVLTFGQAVVHRICRVLAAPDNRNRGLVVLHSTGSGKACAGAAAMDAFLATGDRSVFYVTTVAGLRANGPATFRACGTDFFPRVVKAVDDKRVTFLTFARFAHVIMNPASVTAAPYAKRLARALVVVDEVHNLFKPLPTQKEEHREIVRFFSGRHPRAGDYDVKYVIMTATPGDEPQELVDLLNIVRDRRREELRVPDHTNPRAMVSFAREIAGLVSYVDLSNDTTVFPRVTEDETVECEMGPVQFDRYVDQVLRTSATRDADRETLAQDDALYRYWIGPRKYANTLHEMPSQQRGSAATPAFTPEGPVADQGWPRPFPAGDGQGGGRYNLDQVPRSGPRGRRKPPARDPTPMPYEPANELHEFSAKLPRLFERVVAAPEQKHYVYSAFSERHGFGGHGVMAIAKLLTKLYGYKQLTAGDARRLVASEGGPPPAAKRFVIMTPAELRGDSTSETVEQENVDAIRAIFNSGANARGEIVHVMLASQYYNEGIDLRAVRHIHFLEPLISYNAERQAVGRAVRHCSHAQLRKDYGEWQVSIHRYMATAPPLEVRMVDLDNIRSRIDALQTLMLHTADPAALREQKDEMDRLQADLVVGEKALTETHETIDHFIYNEARQRYKAMVAMQLAVVMAAVDCPLTRDFHGTKTPCLGGGVNAAPSQTSRKDPS
jgi:hypothetical protein